MQVACLLPGAAVCLFALRTMSATVPQGIKNHLSRSEVLTKCRSFCFMQCITVGQTHMLIVNISLLTRCGLYSRL